MKTGINPTGTAREHAPLPAGKTRLKSSVVAISTKVFSDKRRGDEKRRDRQTRLNSRESLTEVRGGGAKKATMAAKRRRAEWLADRGKTQKSKRTGTRGGGGSDIEKKLANKWGDTAMPGGRYRFLRVGNHTRGRVANSSPRKKEERSSRKKRILSAAGSTRLLFCMRDPKQRKKGVENPTRLSTYNKGVEEEDTKNAVESYLM